MDDEIAKDQLRATYLSPEQQALNDVIQSVKDMGTVLAATNQKITSMEGEKAQLLSKIASQDIEISQLKQKLFQERGKSSDRGLGRSVEM